MKIWIFWSTSSNNKNIVKESEKIWKFISTINADILTWGVTWYPHIVAKSNIKNWWKSIAYWVWIDINDHLFFHNNDLKDYTNIIFLKKYTNNKLDLIDNYTRSLNMCFDVDIAIIIWWRVWTMYEFTILSWLWKDIYILEDSWWITWQTIKYFKLEWNKNNSKIQYFKNTEDLKKIINKI